MPSIVDLSPVLVQTGSDDEQGQLAFSNGKLVAVLVRLTDEIHLDLVGKWHLEAGFGPCASPPAPTFENLDLAARWIERKLQQ